MLQPVAGFQLASVHSIALRSDMTRAYFDGVTGWAFPASNTIDKALQRVKRKVGTHLTAGAELT